MNKDNVLKQLSNSGIIPVMRNMNPESIVSIIEALRDGGLNAVDLSTEQKGGIEAIRAAKSHYGDALCIGAGTVLSEAQAQSAIEAGADFIVTPIVSKEVIALANKAERFIACGALTPTEIFEAHMAGADLVKVFPADAMGASYFKNVKGPLRSIPLMPTGGITLSNLGDYVKNGAICVGVGSAIYQYETNAEITNAAKAFVSAFQLARN